MGNELYQDEQLEPAELRLKAAGDRLAMSDREAAEAIADALEHIARVKRERDDWRGQACELRRQAAGRRDAKARARRPR